ncbi:MAG: AI-2E family transporter [Clostridium sp.]|nr:AI-2E family transporter [Clostridium sp.]
MKNPRFKGYIYWGVTALAVITCSVTFVFFLLEFKMVAAAAGKIVSVLMPIIYGAVLAYLMLPVYNKTRRYITESMSVKVKNERVVQGAAKGVGTLVSLLLLIAIVVGLCWMILPQIYTSILGLQESFSENINNLSIWLQKQLKDNEALEQMVVPVYEQITDKLETWLYDTLVPNMSMVINILSSGLLGMVTVLKNSLIGLIVMVYFLNIKDTFSAQSKKFVYSLFPLKQANRIIEEVRFTHSMFGGFITGKLLDSLIIGVLCFFCLRLLRMPYVLLISVIIGVTNVIPFFGPFIGAIPSAFLILLVSPMKCLYFLLFVLVLQQFDGNILGPKILGDSTGLPNFWALFSILLFGGLFGFVGMVIAVPTFAVIYHLTSEYVNRCLEKKALSQRTDDYRDLDYIDEAGNEYIERKD